ncbi:hypothetical protein [Photorhabdus bodei]|nr:hypothetical protein [Photorhabdus bodei]
MTGVSECSQQRGNLKDDGYNFGQIILPKLGEIGVCQKRLRFNN